jgi:hypothetical protein
MCDRPDAYRVIIRRAVKNHQCRECARDIVPGTRYQYASGIWDGNPGSIKTCLLCAEAWETYWAACPHECIAAGGLLMAYRESFGLGHVADSGASAAVIGHIEGLLYAQDIAYANFLESKAAKRRFFARIESLTDQ